MPVMGKNADERTTEVIKMGRQCLPHFPMNLVVDCRLKFVKCEIDGFLERARGTSCTIPFHNRPQCRISVSGVIVSICHVHICEKGAGNAGDAACWFCRSEERRVGKECRSRWS